MAPGTGKTLTTIRYINKYNTILIVCRRDDYMTWYDQMTEDGWSPKRIYRMESSKVNWKALRRHVQSHKYRVVMVTYDLVKNPMVFRFIRSIFWDVCVADEVHYIKRMKSARTQKVIQATRHIDRRLGLTGSPITNKPIDVFSIGLFIDDGRTFGNNEWRFKNKYYLKSGPGFYKRRNASDQIAKKLQAFAFHVHEDDVLKLPPKRYIKEYCQMTSIQKRYYQQVLDDWEMEMQDGTIHELSHVIVRTEKLRQISSGFMITPPDENGHKETIYLRSGKLKKLEDMLYSEDYLGDHKKIVIWCSRTAEIRMVYKLVRKHGDKAVRFFGSNRANKNQARVSFRDDPKVRFFIAQVDSGVGMNELVVASDAVYFSNSTKVVSRQQSELRTRRIGSEHHNQITYWDLISEGAIDGAILGNVKSSMDTAQYILDQLKNGVPLRRAIHTSFQAGKKCA